MVIVVRKVVAEHRGTHHLKKHQLGKASCRVFLQHDLNAEMFEPGRKMSWFDRIRILQGPRN